MDEKYIAVFEKLASKRQMSLMDSVCIYTTVHKCMSIYNGIVYVSENIRIYLCFVNKQN